MNWSRRRNRRRATFALAALLAWPAAARAVEVDPLRVELTGAPGQTLTGTLTLTNRRADPVRVTAKTGAYRYVFTAHTISPSDPQAQRLPSCESWLTVVTPAAPLEGGAMGTLSYTVIIPTDAGQSSAEYVAALLVDEHPVDAPAPGDSDAPGHGTITVLPRIALPVYILLAGHDTPQGRIAGLQADPGPQAGVTRLLLTLANDGAVHLRPSGTVLVTDARGTVVSRTPLGRTIPIFPGFQEGIPFLLPLTPGRYTAAATVQFSAAAAGKLDLFQRQLTFTVAADGHVQTDR